MKSSQANSKQPALSGSKNFNLLSAVIVVALVGAAGYFILATRASGLYLSQEAENSTVTGHGALVNDSTASGNKALKFGTGLTAGYTVVGNKIINPSGQAYIPFGVVVWCLSTPGLSCTTQSPNDSDKITAASSYWHANTVRIQVAEENLYGGSGGSLDLTYVAKLDAEVSLANSLGMIAIVTQQTERFNSSLLPDANSLKFWNYMSGHYAANPKVFFDLFNEPRLNITQFNGTEADEWNLWQNGGTVTLTGSSSPTTYVGMQTLVNAIRAKAQNIIVAEANHGDKDLSQLTTHLLTGSNISYGIEPNLYASSTFASFWLNNANENPAEWDYNWGNLSKTYPLMVEAFNDHPGGGCYANSAAVMPQLLSYLQAHGMGMVFFSLDPGVGVIGTNLQSPTSFSGSTFDCSSPSIIPTSTQGAGALFRAWSVANSIPQ